MQGDKLFDAKFLVESHVSKLKNPLDVLGKNETFQSCGRSRISGFGAV